MHLFQDETGEGTTPSSFWGTHTSLAVLEQIHQASFTMSRNCAYWTASCQKWYQNGMVTVGLFIFFFLLNGILTFMRDIRYQIYLFHCLQTSPQRGASWWGKKIPTGPMQLAGAIHTNSSVIVWLTLKSYSHEAPTLIFTDHYSQKSSQLDSNGNVPIY